MSRNPADLRVIFMGTPDFAVPTLETLFALGCQVVGVVSQPDKQQGRGRKVQPTPVAACAARHGAPLFQWPRLNDESYATLRGLAPDLCVVVAYGKILPRRYLDLPPLGCLNGHASVLPELRGAAPIQWAVIRGYRETGVSIMQMAEGMDTGDVGLVRTLAIGPDETAGELHDRLAPLTAEAMREAIEGLSAGTLTFAPQDHERATLAPRLTKEDGRLDWRQPARELHDRVRGTNPWPGAFVERGGEALKIHRTRLAAGGGLPGTVIAHDPEGPRIACGDGAVTLLELQRPGRNAVDGAAFLRGTPLPVGERI